MIKLTISDVLFGYNVDSETPLHVKNLNINSVIMYVKDYIWKCKMANTEPTKENVKIEAATQTFATITLFDEPRKMSDSTGGETSFEYQQPTATQCDSDADASKPYRYLLYEKAERTFFPDENIIPHNLIKKCKLCIISVFEGTKKA